MGINIGIDLGTSNSVVARMTDTGPVVIEDNSGHRLHPSVVALGHGSKPIVGEASAGQAGLAASSLLAAPPGRDWQRSPASQAGLPASYLHLIKAQLNSTLAIGYSA